MELATLKNNNARLTSALQESTANVEEWKRQLQAYKDENQRVKSKIVELEAGRGPPITGEGGNDLKREVATLRLKIDSLETELRAKDDEIRRLSNEMREMSMSADRVKVPPPFQISFYAVLVLFLSIEEAWQFRSRPNFCSPAKMPNVKIYCIFPWHFFYKRCQLIAQSASTVSHRKGDSKVSRERPTYRGPHFFSFSFPSSSSNSFGLRVLGLRHPLDSCPLQ